MPEQRFEQSQGLHLHQTIAPQMQQSLQVLQAATMDLRNLVRQELEENPVLEDETTDVSLEETAKDNDDEAFEDLKRQAETGGQIMSRRPCTMVPGTSSSRAMSRRIWPSSSRKALWVK